MLNITHHLFRYEATFLRAGPAAGRGVTIVGTHMAHVKAILKQLTVPCALIIAMPLCREVA